MIVAYIRHSSGTSSDAHRKKKLSSKQFGQIVAGRGLSDDARKFVMNVLRQSSCLGRNREFVLILGQQEKLYDAKGSGMVLRIKGYYGFINHQNVWMAFEE